MLRLSVQHNGGPERWILRDSTEWVESKAVPMSGRVWLCLLACETQSVCFRVPSTTKGSRYWHTIDLGSSYSPPSGRAPPLMQKRPNAFPSAWSSSSHQCSVHWPYKQTIRTKEDGPSRVITVKTTLSLYKDARVNRSGAAVDPSMLLLSRPLSYVFSPFSRALWYV